MTAQASAAKRQLARTPASEGGRPDARRTGRRLFALACLSVLGLAAFLGSSAPTVGAAETLPGQGFLPDNRSWEMVSPTDKNGGLVGGRSQRLRAAADGSAMSFVSATAFADAHGAGVDTEYIARRTGSPGTSGWETHGITPLQEPITVPQIINGIAPLYAGEFSPDLDRAVFRGITPLTDEPNVAKVPNLYLRDGLLTPGPGSYTLLTGCPGCTGPFETPNFPGEIVIPEIGGASADLGHIAFESEYLLTGPGSKATRTYMSENGSLRLIGLVPPGADTTCGGGGPACIMPTFNDGASILGRGAMGQRYTPRVVSSDGSRVNFSAPVTKAGSIIDFGSNPNERSQLFQRDSQGTPSLTDDTTIKVSASEKDIPSSPLASFYETASTDGSRVFFSTPVALTDDVPSSGGQEHIYIWSRDELNDERQKLTVQATGGDFRLVFKGEETADVPFDATAEEVEAALEALSAISDSGGEVSVAGGPSDAMGTSPYTIDFSGGDLAETDLSLGADRSGLEAPTGAVIDAREIIVWAEEGTFTLTFDGETTVPLPAGVTAAQMEAALNDLASISGVGGSVTVTGGPGNCCGSFPLTLTFGGSLAGHEADELIIDDSSLEGVALHSGGLTVTAGAGSYTLSFGGQTTAPIPFDASPGAIKAALEALPSIGGVGGWVVVNGGPGDAIGSKRYGVSFAAPEGSDPPNSLEGELPTNITADASGLEGGAALTAQLVKGGGHLTLIDVDREPADDPGDFGRVIGASEDGSRVYFIEDSQLVDGEELLPNSANGSHGIYLWDEGEITYIGALEAGNSTADNLPASDTWTAGGMSPSRVTPDGMALLFKSRDAVGPTGYDHGSTCGPSVLIPGDSPCSELYVYRADTDELQCASCNPSGAAATVSATIFSFVNTGGSLGTSYRNRPLSEDGRYVFFSTAERLVPEDRNGKIDAYRYDTVTEEPALLTSGFSERDSYFIDASADGSSAFVYTSEALSGWDLDEAYDIYDARVGGGFPEPQAIPPSCQGDTCQPPPAQLNDPTPASSSFVGSGDVTTPKNCASLARRAGRLSRKSKALARKAKRTNPPRGASRLRNRSREAAKKARSLSRDAERCSRANRRAAR